MMEHSFDSGFRSVRLTGSADLLAIRRSRRIREPRGTRTWNLEHAPGRVGKIRYTR